MALPKSKVSKSRSNKKSANWKIVAPNLVECTNCKAKILSHRACPVCGFYNGKKTVQIKEKKKEE